jgi:hypothetical protein
MAGAAATPWLAAEAAAADGFPDAAAALAGSGALPPFVIETARRMLVAQFGAPAVADLVTATAAWRRGAALPDAVEPVAQRLLVILFTGETDATDPRARTGHYPWALAWQVLRFAKAPGLCSGTFGDWART